LVGCCFTCFLADHIATVCKFPSRCLRCHRAGHQTCSCKQPRSSDVAGLLPRQHRLASGKQPRLTSVVVINLKVGNVAVAEQRGRRSRSHSSTPPDQDEVPTLEGSPSRHSHPSPPPLPPPLSAAPPPPPQNHRHHFKLQVIPCTPAKDVDKEELANALVAVVGGTQP
jgi:hypothetical protein